jgi:hypothetical protein
VEFTDGTSVRLQHPFPYRTSISAAEAVSAIVHVSRRKFKNIGNIARLEFVEKSADGKRTQKPVTNEVHSVASTVLWRGLECA